MQLRKVQISMSDSRNRSRSRTRNKRVSEQTSEERAERLQQRRRRSYTARSGNKTPQERESKLLKLRSNDTVLATFAPSLNLPLKYLILRFFLLLFTGESLVTIPWTVAKLVKQACTRTCFQFTNAQFINL